MEIKEIGDILLWLGIAMLCMIGSTVGMICLFIIEYYNWKTEKHE